MAVTLGSATAFLRIDAKQFNKELQEAEFKAQGFGKRTSSAFASMSKASAALGATGAKLTKGLTLPIVAAGAAMIKVGSDFKAGMSEVQAVGQLAQNDMDALTKKAIEMGAKTKFSASESAEGFKFMAQAGWGTQQMLEGIEGTMSLAAAGELDLASATDITVAAVSSFGYEAQDAGRVADALATAAAASTVDVTDLGESFKYVGPIAGALKYDIEDVGVAIGLMGNNGIKGSQAGTSLRKMLTSMSKPTAAVAKSMEELGLNLYDSAGNAKPFDQVMGQLRSSFSGLTQQQKTQHAATLAGQTGMAGLLSIVNASSADFDKMTASMANTSGAADQMAAVMMDNLKGDIEELSGAAETLGIQLYDNVDSPLRSLAQSATEVINWFAGLSAETQGVIIKVGLFAAALGPCLMLMSGTITSAINVATNVKKMGAAFSSGVKLVGGFARAVALGTTVTNVNTAATAINATVVQRAGMQVGAATSRLMAFAAAHKVATLAVLGVVGVLIGLGIAIAKAGSFEAFGAKVQEIFGKVQEVAVNVFNAVAQNLPVIISTIVSTASTLFQSLASTMQEILPVIMAKIAEMLPVMLPMLITTLTSLLVTLINLIAQYLPLFITTFTQLIVTLITTIAQMAPQLITMITTLLITLVNAIVQNLPTIINAIITVITTIATLLPTMIPQLIQAAITLFLALVNAIPQIIPPLITALVSMMGVIVSNLVGALPALIDAAIQLFMALVQAIPQILPPLIAALPQIITALVDGLITALPLLIEAAIMLFMALVQAIPQIIPPIVKALPTIIKAITGALIKALPQLISAAGTLLLGIVQAVPTVLGSIISTIKNVGGDIARGLWEGIKKLKDWVLDKIKGLGTALLDGLKSVLGISSPSKVTTQYGVYLLEGLTKGLNTKAKRKAAIETAKSMGKELTSAMEEGLAGNSSALTSGLDKLQDELTSYKQTVIKNLKDQIKTEKAAIKSAKNVMKQNKKGTKEYSRAAKQLKVNTKASKKHQKEQKRIARLYAQIQAEIDSYSNTLDFLGTQMDSITEAVDNQEAEVERLTDQMNDYASSVKDTFTGFANITDIEYFDEITEKVQTVTGAWEEQTTRRTKTAKDFVEEMKKKVETAQDFYSKIQDLHEMGLNQTAIDQILSMGVEEGGAFAGALLDGLDSNMVTAINNSYSQIAKLGTTLGNNLANDYYGAGVQAAQGLLAGLRSQQAELEYQMNYYGMLMADALRRSLLIASPSKVMKGLGVNTIDGLVTGITSSEKDVKSAMDDISSTVDEGSEKLNLTSSATSAFSELIDCLDVLDKSLYKTMTMLVDNMGRLIAVTNGVSTDGTFKIVGANGSSVDSSGNVISTSSQAGDTYVFNNPRRMTAEEQARAAMKERRKRELGF